MKANRLLSLVFLGLASMVFAADEPVMDDDGVISAGGKSIQMRPNSNQVLIILDYSYDLNSNAVAKFSKDAIGVQMFPNKVNKIEKNKITWVSDMIEAIGSAPVVGKHLMTLELLPDGKGKVSIEMQPVEGASVTDYYMYFDSAEPLNGKLLIGKKETPIGTADITIEARPGVALSFWPDDEDRKFTITPVVYSKLLIVPRVKRFCFYPKNNKLEFLIDFQ